MHLLQFLTSRGLRTRLIVAFLITVLIPLIGTGLYGNWTTSRTLEAQALTAVRGELRLRADKIESYLGGARDDLLFLSQLNSLQNWLTTEEPVAVEYERIQHDFISFISTHPNIFQIRYINENGDELLRIDSAENNSTITPNYQLQNKSSRYYFRTTMQFALGDVYVSPIDLNRELGEVQQPPIPTIRYATPVFHIDGQRAGIVIINFYAEPFLAFARQTTGDDRFSLVDQSGYYLVHPDIGQEWGSPDDLDTGHNIQDAYPAIWTQLTETVSPELFYPLQSEVLIFERVQQPADSAQQWWLLYETERANLFASITSFRLTAISILLFAVLTALGMAVWLASSLTAPIRQLTEDVRQFGRKRSTSPTPQAPVPHDEIKQLTVAFGDMSTAIDQHLTQLAELNRAGHHIAARVARPDVLAASCEAAQRLLPTDYVVLTLQNQIVYSGGDEAWAEVRNSADMQNILHYVQEDSNWHTSHLEDTNGYLCCAPLHVDGKLGLIELYGSDQQLGNAATGDLLATLAVQISIALDNATLYDRLALRKVELETLLQRLINVQEEERRVVAYDIHDGLIQMLVSARMQLRNFTLDRGQHDGQAEIALQKGLKQLAESIVEARRVIEGLRPAALDDLGLVATIRHFSAEMCLQFDCQLEFSSKLGTLRLPMTVETTAFRIMQEAVTNVRKYADTPKLRVALYREDDKLQLLVQDWGQGFDVSAVAKGRGVGLFGMRERAKLLGGHCEIESKIGEGSCITAWLPIKDKLLHE